MAHPLLLALFPNYSTAEIASRDIQRLGIPREDLSVVATTHQLEGAIADEIGGSPGSEIEDSRTAGRAGELIGSLMGAVGAGVPGFGMVAAGPLAAEMGEAAGHVANRLSATLVDAGLSVDEAEQWKERIHAGGVLLGVHARSADPDAVARLLAGHSDQRILKTEWQG